MNKCIDLVKRSQTTGRFDIKMNRDFRREHAGEKIYVLGTSFSGNEKLFLANSGQFVVPAPSPASFPSCITLDGTKLEGVVIQCF